MILNNYVVLRVNSEKFNHYTWENVNATFLWLNIHHFKLAKKVPLLKFLLYNITMAQLNAGRMRISLQCDCAVVATISHLQSCMYAYLSLLVEFLLKQEKSASSSMRHKKSTTLELVVDSLDDV